MLDNLSGGRIELGVGMGYAPHEFRGFGIPLPQRLSRTEEGLEVLRRCFTGERFSFHGTRYQFDDVVIRPRYVQPGGPPLWIAAMSAGGALRAARFDGHLLPQGPRDQVLEPWQEALTRVRPRSRQLSRRHHPRLPGHRRPRARLARGARRRALSRRALLPLLRRVRPLPARRARRPRASRRPGWWATSTTACAELSTFIAEHGITDLVTWAVPPGLHPEQMNASLERFARDVVPAAESRERHPCMNPFRSGVGIERSR